MKIYLAGNFPQVNIKGREEKICKMVLLLHPYYSRLISFYYIDIFMPVFDLKINKETKSKPQKEKLNAKKKNS